MTFNAAIEEDSLDMQSYYFRGKTKMIFESDSNSLFFQILLTVIFY